MLHKVVSNVSAVVDTEPDCNDQVYAADGVDGEAPEVDEAANIDESEEDADQDDDAGGDVLDENERCDEDTEEREAHVPPELQLYHLISFPARIVSGHGKCSVGKVGFGNNLFDFVHCWNPF